MSVHPLFILAQDGWAFSSCVPEPILRACVGFFCPHNQPGRWGFASILQVGKLRPREVKLVQVVTQVVPGHLALLLHHENVL